MENGVFFKHFLRKSNLAKVFDGKSSVFAAYFMFDGKRFTFLPRTSLLMSRLLLPLPSGGSREGEML